MNAALKARFNPDSWFSIPDVTLIEVDAGATTQDRRLHKVLRLAPLAGRGLR